MYNRGDKIICKETFNKFSLPYYSQTIKKYEIYIILSMYEYTEYINNSKIKGVDCRIEHIITKNSIHVKDYEIVKYFETLPERRLRIIDNV